MSEIQDLFDLQREHLVGKMVFTDRCDADIISIEVPEFNDITIIGSSDFQNANIEMFGDSIPLFAESHSYYVGQPVIAVFGNDWASVDAFISKVKINYSEETNTKIDDKPVFEYSWKKGKLAPFEEADEKHIIRSKFVVKRHSVSLLGNQRIFASYSEGKLDIQLSSQWIPHIKKTISSCLGLNHNSINVHPIQFQALFDQLLIGPEIASAIASCAAIKTNGFVEFSMPMTSWQPEVTFSIATMIDDQSMPIIQKANITAELGAFPIFASEYAYSLIAGIIPSYNLEGALVNVGIYKSSNVPAAFFSDLGYSVALLACESHYSELVSKCGLRQSDWRSQILEKSEIKEALCLGSLSTYLKKTLDEAVEDSWFERNYASNNQIKASKSLIPSFMSYNRGVGLACGQGVQGFSNKFNYLSEYAISASYTSEGKLVVYCSVMPRPEVQKVWLDVIKQNLDISSGNISFENSSQKSDIGPDVLSRNIKFIPSLLDVLSKEINTKLKAKSVSYPIMETVCVNNVEKKELYESGTCGTVIVSLSLDSVMLVPKIDHVWARIRFGKVYNKELVINRLRQLISRTIDEFCPCAQNTYSIDINIHENATMDASSASSLVRGLTAASLVSALNQAFGHVVNQLPISENDILDIIKMQTKEVSDEI